MKSISFSVELSKRKRLNIWLIPLFFTGILLIWQYWGNRRSTASGYAYTLYQLSLLNSLIMPLMISVISSRCCDMEWKGDTLKQLYTMQRRTQFYDNKFLHEALYLLLFVVLECLTIPLCGAVFSYRESLKPLPFLLHGMAALAVGLALLTLQHYFSLTFQNQIIPLFMGLAGSFLGLFALYLPKRVSRWILWSYFAGFMTVEMHWDSDTREVWFTPVSFPLLKFCLFTLFGLGMYMLCRCLFLKKEV